MNTSTVAEFLSKAADQASGDYGDLTYIWFNATLEVLTIDPTITHMTSSLVPFSGSFCPQRPMLWDSYVFFLSLGPMDS